MDIGVAKLYLVLVGANHRLRCCVVHFAWVEKKSKFSTSIVKAE